LIRYDIEAFVDDELTADQQQKIYDYLLNNLESQIYCEEIVQQNLLLKQWWNKKKLL
jgi:hypothetical protein